MGVFKQMSAVKSTEKVTNFYQADESDNSCQKINIEDLVNNIDRLESLKKRLNFMLTEIDLCINKR